jgi:glycosyltransferase involved in cell wall biosynthesis
MSSALEPLVSVVMPVYDGARFLDQAINSIREQSFRNFQFIIVDDGSQDASPDILSRHAAEDPRIEISVLDKNCGYIEALNRGLAAAEGKYVARMDQDDIAKPLRLEMQLDFLEANPGIALVGGAIELIDSQSRVFETVWLPLHPEELRRDLRGYGNAIAHPTVFFRRHVFEEAGGFRKAYRAAEDYDLWLRMMEKFDLANLGSIVLGYRRHESSISSKNAKQQAVSALCARITAQLRLQGRPDPTSTMKLITEAVLRDLGVTQDAIDEAIFKNILGLSENAIKCGFCSAAADFVRIAKRYASPETLARTSYELNRKAMSTQSGLLEQRKQRLTLLTSDPATYYDLFKSNIIGSKPQLDSLSEWSASHDTPMFSVVVPVYNHANYVREAVRSALRSPLVKDVVLVDDGSADASADILCELANDNPSRVYNLTTKDHRNRGAHNRLNALVEAAKCAWVAVLNSDDVFVDGRFEAIIAHASFLRCEFACGNLLLMNAAGGLVTAKRGPFDPGKHFPRSFDVEKMVGSGDLLDLLSHQNWLGTTSNMVFTKALHARIGGFAAYRYVHDWDFALRAMALARCCYVRRYITAYRMHSDNTINESAARVNDEARHMFDRLLKDLPHLIKRPNFRIGLEQNINLAAKQSTNIVEADPTDVVSA